MQDEEAERAEGPEGAEGPEMGDLIHELNIDLEAGLGPAVAIGIYYRIQPRPFRIHLCSLGFRV